MDFEFSSEQEELRQTVRRFLSEQAPISPYVRSLIDDERGTTDIVWKGLAAMGAVGLLAPEEYGGSGSTMVDMGVVLEEMGRVVHPGPFLSSAVGAVSAVVALGSDHDKRALLPSLADGTTVATLALLEPGGRGDWRRMSCRESARTLTGTKVHVADAMAADTLLVSAVGTDGLGLYVVDREATGVSVEASTTVDPTRLFGTVRLDGAPARRLGSGDATAALQSVVDRVLIAMVVDGVGAAAQALDLAVAYAKERTQFGRVIGSFQAVQHLCADMLQDLEVGRAGAYYGLWAADGADPSELHRAATMAKAYCGDAFFRVGASTIQVFGGIGYTWEHDAHLFYKRLLTLQQAYGTSSDHLEALAGLIV